MGNLVSSLVAGLLFGLGLTVSGMTNPAKVIGFLDVTGNWDPTLALVMGGAVAVTLLAFRIVKRLAHPVFAARFELPTRRDLDRRLVAGSVLFGLGWGLVGLCPGPALTALMLAPHRVGVFVAAMLAGMLLFRLLPQPAASARGAAGSARS